eukprot:10014582-Alexandrium_andersonii.AAC.1
MCDHPKPPEAGLPAFWWSAVGGSALLQRCYKVLGGHGKRRSAAWRRLLAQRSKATPAEFRTDTQ